MSLYSVVDPWSVEFVERLVRLYRDDVTTLLESRKSLREDPRGHVTAVLQMPVVAGVREDGWTIVPPPEDLVDRRVEITGPAVSPRMALHAINSGANGYMVDGEDSLAPTWSNVLATHSNVMGLVRRTLREGDVGVSSAPAVLHYRPRGLHMKEANWIVDGQPAPACLIDVGLFLYHNARELVARGSGPYLYLPKLETEHEAWMWNRLFGWVETELGLSHGTIRCTVLVETLPGLLRLEPIVWSLRERLTGLNVGRWDYLFSCIKVMSRDRSHVLPDRSRLTMDRPELVEYARWVVHVAHRRGAHAIGGMAADVPSRRDPEVTRRALAVVKSDKEREASLGHDGTWVAHPDLVEVARRTFDRVLCGRVEQRDVVPGFDELDVGLVMCGGNERVTESGVRDAVRTALVYVDAWMSGNGCVAMGGKMEDAATAEISRALLWQWVDRGVVMEDGRRVTLDMVTAVVRGEAAALAAAGTAPRIEAVEVVWRSVASSTPPEFITTEASCVSFQPMLVS